MRIVSGRRCRARLGMTIAVSGILVLSGETARAQVLVRVSDPRGASIASARIEAWSPFEMLLARLSDSLGIARLPRAEVARTSAILVRRIGFRPVTIRGSSLADTVLVVLEPIAGSLPTVTVNGTRGRCPQDDQAAAQRHWMNAAAHYRTPSLDGREAVLEAQSRTTSESEIGAPAASEARGFRFYTHWGMTGARNSIVRNGFVFALTGTHSYDDFGAWFYPPLHAELAGIFADSLFVVQHTLSVVSTTTRGVELMYCPRDERRPGIQGTLAIDASGALLEARWRFINPDRGQELAGGEVQFAPPSDSGPTPLFSTSGLFWRRLPSGAYRQSWQRFERWKLLHDSVGAARSRE